MTSTNKNYISSKCEITEFILDVTGEGAFSNANHLLTIKEERRDGDKNRDGINNSKLKDYVTDIDSADWHIIICNKNTGAWMNVQVTMITVTLLLAT